MALNQRENQKGGRKKGRSIPLFDRLFLASTAWVDATLYAIFSSFRTAWRWYDSFTRSWSLHGIRFFLAALISELLTMGFAGLFLLVILAQPTFEEIKGRDWKNLKELSVVFLDRNGQEIGRRGILLDDSFSLSEIPPHLIQALLATEDRRFYWHFGIDFVGTTRALLENARAEGVRQGGSSLSQQLAKMLFLSNERTLKRKVKEVFLAFWLEANLTKDQILKLYLDRAYTGAGLSGVATASEFYFGKPITRVTLSEAAMLAGLFKAPGTYAPHINLPAARMRANQVLLNMQEAGFLTRSQVIEAQRHPASVVLRKENFAADYFLDWAFEEVKKVAPPNQRILIANTTLDLDLQRAAGQAVESLLLEDGESYRVQQAALVCMRMDGAVQAMVGGRDYGASQFNRAVDAIRQPGSAFKPFVYMAAFLAGYTPSSIVTDAPIRIGNWAPRNYLRRYQGPVTLKTALTQSINTIPVRLAQAIGRGAIIDVAQKMGITTPLPITRALPLGVADVRVLDMTAAYNSFANGGFRTPPYGVTQLRDLQGNVLWRAPVFSQSAQMGFERLFPEEKVAQMNNVLRNVVEAGTGRRAQLEGIMAAGKTGTTQAYRDAWFVGYTAYYTTAVWAGNDNFSSTRRMTGGTLPAMIWKEFMEKAHLGLAPRPIAGLEEEGTRQSFAKKGTNHSSTSSESELLEALQEKEMATLSGEIAPDTRKVLEEILKEVVETAASPQG